MNSKLAESLMNKNIIKPGTLVYGTTTVTGMGQTLTTAPVEVMVENYQNNIFYCRDRLGKQYIMPVENVDEVDGMEPARLASIFNIKPDGSDKAAGKKRGRKPKTAHINTAEGEIHGKDKRTEDHDQVK